MVRSWAPVTIALESSILDVRLELAHLNSLTEGLYALPRDQECKVQRLP